MSGPMTCSKTPTLEKQEFKFSQWTIISHKSHILESKCIDEEKCPSVVEPNEKCLFCRYEATLNIGHFPDMTFAKNSLRIQHEKGFGIEFNALEALKEVKDRAMLKVFVAEEWLEARKDCEYAKQLKENFDWTFSTEYPGHTICLDQNGQEIINADYHKQNNAIRVFPSDKLIPFEKLKVQEEILFIDEIDLFEDELADNGVAKLSVRIRVMNEKIYILQRFFLRVDRKKVKIHDTRLYYEEGQGCFIREISHWESDEPTMERITSHGIIDANQMIPLLPKPKIKRHELVFPPY